MKPQPDKEGIAVAPSQHAERMRCSPAWPKKGGCKFCYVPPPMYWRMLRS